MSMVFCRGCGKEIHETASACPHCGALQNILLGSGNGQFLTYDQVPWYRKNWFAIVCFLIFSPGLLIVLLTGDVYYESKGNLRAYSKGAKIFLIVVGVLYLMAIMFRE